MKTLLLVAACLVAPALCFPENEENGPEFLRWAATHKISYGSDEIRGRFVTWLKNRAFINKHNDQVKKGLHTYTMGLNQFGAMRNDEYRRTVLGISRGSASQATETFHSDNKAPAPTSWDWRTHGIVTAVKNQASCGSW